MLGVLGAFSSKLSLPCDLYEEVTSIGETAVVHRKRDEVERRGLFYLWEQKLEHPQLEDNGDQSGGFGGGSAASRVRCSYADRAQIQGAGELGGEELEAMGVLGYRIVLVGRQARRLHFATVVAAALYVRRASSPRHTYNLQLSS